MTGQHVSPAMIILAAAILSAGIQTAACGRRQTSVSQPAYRPFYAMPRAATAQARGTLKGDFDWAASAPTLEEATTRWTAFLRAHEPADGEFEDGFQRNHVRAAQYELMRVLYLRGHTTEGDTLLTKLEDVLRRQ